MDLVTEPHACNVWMRQLKTHLAKMDPLCEPISTRTAKVIKVGDQVGLLDRSIIQDDLDRIISVIDKEIDFYTRAILIHGFRKAELRPRVEPHTLWTRIKRLVAPPSGEIVLFYYFLDELIESDQKTIQSLTNLRDLWKDDPSSLKNDII